MALPPPPPPDSGEDSNEINNGSRKLPKYANEIMLKTTIDAADNNNKTRRTISYAMGGDLKSYETTALIFYPAGASRRSILSFHPIAKSSRLRVLSINRAGKGETSVPPPKKHHGDPYKAFVDTTINDVLTVLEKEDIHRVHIVCMCAGTTFALAFSSQHHDRVLSITAIAPWCQPADVDPPELTSKVYHVGTGSPLWLISPIVASVMGSMQGSLSIIPNSLVSRQLRKVLSGEEWEQLEKSQMSMEEFKKVVTWMQNEESGGVNATEIGVLLHPGRDMGIDYAKVANLPIRIFHGEKDAITPYLSVVKWFYPLFDEASSSQMTCLLEGSHEGSLFLLHPPIIDAIQSLSKAKRGRTT